MIKIKTNNQGQTLIEAVVAVAIIGIAMVGFLSRSTQNYLAISETLERNQALNLARESIEIVRNMRDSNWLKGCFDPADSDNCKYWNSGLHVGNEYRAVIVFDEDTTHWVLDFINNDFDSCIENEQCRLYQREYGLIDGNSSNAEPLDFYRQVEMRPICESQTACGGDGICMSGEACPDKQIGIEVISRVRWHRTNGWRNVILTDYLYNWR